MIDLIGNILDMDKIETGQMLLAPQPTDLGALLRKASNCSPARPGNATWPWS